MNVNRGRGPKQKKPRGTGPQPGAAGHTRT